MLGQGRIPTAVREVPGRQHGIPENRPLNRSSGSTPPLASDRLRVDRISERSPMLGNKAGWSLVWLAVLQSLSEKILTRESPGSVPGATRSQIRISEFHPGKVIRLLWPVAWLNAYFIRYAGGSSRPAFFDVDKTFPALNLITEHFAVIREELDAVLAEKSTIPNYHEMDFIQYSISAKIDKHRNWKIFMLDAMGERPAANRALCPQTYAGRYPGFVSGIFFDHGS